MRNPAELEAEYAASHAPPSSPPPKRAVGGKNRKARDPAALRAALEQAAEEAAAPPPPPGPDRTKRECTFPFEFEEGGVTYKAILTNQILNLDNRLQATTLESRLIGGVSYESVDPTMGSVAKGVAHMTFSLLQKQAQDPPGWADNFLELDSANLVLAVFEEVLDHERTFRGLGGDPKSGPKQG